MAQRYIASLNNNNMKVLIAEDDAFLLKMYGMQLTNANFEVVQASNGDEVIKKLSEGEKPDIMLLDIIMPGKTGFDVLEYIKDKPDLRDIPVIILSNLGQDDDIQKALAAGAKDYIVKSNISQEGMLEKINACIGD
jgi:CheY-like chemotaxis protein